MSSLAVMFCCVALACCSDECSNIDSISNELFGQHISGELYLDTDGDTYTEASIQWSFPVFGTQRIHPSIIIYPKCDDDIFTALEFARLCDYKVVIRSGGHQMNALSSCNSIIHKCIQIDMKYYNDIMISISGDNEFVVVESGVRLRRFTQYLDDNDYFLPCGEDPYIGIGGHILTGGNGYLTKSHGILGDYVISFDIILSNTTKLQDITWRNELYWAVLGGSPGGYGIITKFELDLSTTNNAYYPLSTGFIYSFKWNKELMFIFGDLFIIIHEDIHYMDNTDIGTFVLAFSYNFDIKDYVITISWICTGGNHKYYLSQLFLNAAKELSIQPIIRKEIEAPISRLLMEMKQNYYKLNDINSDIAPMPYMMRSYGTKENLDQEFIDLLIDRIELVIKKYGGYLSSGMILMFLFESYAYPFINNNTSYPYREQLIQFTILMFYNETIHKNTKKLTQKWLDDTMEIIMLTAPFGYGNDDCRNIALTFGDVDIHNVEPYYYPNKTAFYKLQEIKFKYDPLDLFHTTFTVPLPLYIKKDL